MFDPCAGMPVERRCRQSRPLPGGGADLFSHMRQDSEMRGHRWVAGDRIFQPVPVYNRQGNSAVVRSINKLDTKGVPVVNQVGGIRYVLYSRWWNEVRVFVAWLETEQTHVSHSEIAPAGLQFGVAATHNQPGFIVIYTDKVLPVLNPASLDHRRCKRRCDQEPRPTPPHSGLSARQCVIAIALGAIHCLAFLSPQQQRRRIIGGNRTMQQLNLTH